MHSLKYQEYFAGGGMVRAALGTRWECIFANDICPDKAAAYQENWGENPFFLGDVRSISPEEVYPDTDLVWASFPCQDLSLAGKGAGLRAENSGAFWPFWKIVSSPELKPKTIVLENVVGSLTSNNGHDFRAICEAISDAGYRAGCVLLDAANFLPQSRKRLFWIAVRNDMITPDSLLLQSARKDLHPRSMTDHVRNFSREFQDNWLWWNVPIPSEAAPTLAELVQDESEIDEWHSQSQTNALLSLMNETNLKKVMERASRSKSSIGTLYRRMRDEGGDKMVQRAEVRFDGIAGCLRTPKGGSSKQTLVIAGNNKVRTRHLSPRETARLMGLSDQYILPSNKTKAYQITGDGVAVPVVAAVVNSIIEPVLDYNAQKDAPQSAENRQDVAVEVAAA